MITITRTLGIAAVICAAAVLRIDGVAAQPADSEETEARADDARAAPAQSEVRPAAESAPESGEVFIPTEEISEDFAVSFPVDI